MNNSLDMNDAIDGFRLKMLQEHGYFDQVANDARSCEDAIQRAEHFVERAEQARSRFFQRLLQLQPEPVQAPPVALQSAPAQTSWNGYTQSNDAFDDDLYELPKVVRGMR